jgi:agmatine deiminase
MLKITKYFFLIMLYTFSIYNCKDSDLPFTPEWSGRHQSIWLAWPVTEILKGQPTWEAHLEIMSHLSRKKIRTDLIVQDEKEETLVIEKLSSRNIPLEFVRFYHVPHSDIWMRDMGPIFVKDQNDKLQIADFRFNDWGYSSISKDEKVDSMVADSLGMENISSNLFSEGGGWDMNSEGIMITTESVQFQRNPNASRTEIEDEYRRILGVKKIIWLPQGLPEDELSFKGPLPGKIFTAITTGGHVDEFVRFLSDDTILLGEVTEEEAQSSPILKRSREVLEHANEILRKEKNLNGKSFQIQRIPMPDPIIVNMKKGDGTFDVLQSLTFEDGTSIKPDESIQVILASSYINYLVTNDLVLMAKYFKPGRSTSMLRKDILAKTILKRAYPTKEIIQLDVDILNAGGGGIHCITQQMPAQ